MNERIKQFIESLDISVSEFERTCNLSNGAVAKMGENTRSSTIDKIISVYPNLNRTWLLTGDGNMLNSDTSQNGEQKAQYQTAERAVSFDKKHVIKYYPSSDARMGDVQFLDNPNEDYVEIVLPGYSECQYAINAFGDSMEPLIKAGQIILLSEWNENFIDWGNIYLIITKSGYRVIKKLYPGEGNGRTSIICKSENEVNYPPFEIQMDDVYKFYLVKGWINRSVI